MSWDVLHCYIVKVYKNSSLVLFKLQSGYFTPCTVIESWYIALCFNMAPVCDVVPRLVHPQLMYSTCNVSVLQCFSEMTLNTLSHYAFHENSVIERGAPDRLGKKPLTNMQKKMYAFIKCIAFLLCHHSKAWFMLPRLRSCDGTLRSYWIIFSRLRKKGFVLACCLLLFGPNLVAISFQVNKEVDSDLNLRKT